MRCCVCLKFEFILSIVIIFITNYNYLFVLGRYCCNSISRNWTARVQVEKL